MPVSVSTGIVEIEAKIAAGAIIVDGNLTIAINAFRLEVDGKRVAFGGAQNQAVADDALSYVYIDNTGALVINTTGWPNQTHIRLGRVTAANGLIIALFDDRILFTAGLDRELNEDASAGESSTAGTTFEQKLKLTTPSVPAGKYKVEWYAEIKHSNVTLNEYCEARVQANDTVDLGGAVNPLPGYQSFSGFAVADLSAGAQEIDIDYRAQGGGTAYIQRARVMFSRIS